MKKLTILVSFMGLLFNGYLFAEQNTSIEGSHARHQQTSELSSDQKLSEMQKDLLESMKTMHGNMEKSLASKNPDVVFAKGMIAHHLGAIDMAKVELKYGTDPEMRKLAQEVINAQGPEIKMMEQWLESKNKE